MAHVKISLPHDVDFAVETHDRDDEYVSEEIIKDQRWAPPQTEVTSLLLKQDSDFIDVGANIGWYSLLAGPLVVKVDTQGFEYDVLSGCKTLWTRCRTRSFSSSKSGPMG
jgi:hypothetical protein